MKEENPLVSVIMSEYNSDIVLLKESIRSIINQTYKNFELVLIDDGSENDLNSIVKEFNDKRIKLYKNEKNCGLVYSLNKALNKAKGVYIVRMDTDDYSYKDRLSKQVEFMEKNPQYTVVGGNVDYFDGNEIWGRTNFYGNITREKIMNGSPLIHPSIIAKKRELLKVGGYPDYNRCEDYALWIELFSKGYKLYNMSDIVLRYHLSINDYKKRILKTRRGFFKLLKNKYKQLNPSKGQIIKMYLKTFFAGICPHQLIYYYHKRKFIR